MEFQLKIARFALILVTALSSASLTAQTVIENVTATATSAWNPGVGDGGILNMTNNSGISAAYDIAATHTTHVSAGNQWHSTLVDTLATITFNLGQSYDLDGIYIWNGNQTDLTNRGVQNFTLSFSNDGTDFTSLYAPISRTLTQSPGGNISAQHFDLSAYSGVTHVRLKIDSNYGGNVSGLSEVMFTSAAAVPEPSVALLSSLAALGFCRRRR